VIRRLAEDPERYEQVRGDRSLVEVFIEESLRFDAPVQLLARTCTEDIQVDGVQLKRGDRILHSIASANRDESVYPDADQFRLDRPKPRDHVGFGAGPHICPGAFLARMETQIAIESLLDRVAKIELAADYVWDPNPVFWALGPRTLRVSITPA
jgi:cytochrome P450